METDSVAPRTEQEENPEQTPESPSVVTDAGLCDLWRCIKQLIRRERKLKKYEQIRNRRCNS